MRCLLVQALFHLAYSVVNAASDESHASETTPKHRVFTADEVKKLGFTYDTSEKVDEERTRHIRDHNKRARANPPDAIRMVRSKNGPWEPTSETNAEYLHRRVIAARQRSHKYEDRIRRERDQGLRRLAPSSERRTELYREARNANPNDKLWLRKPSGEPMLDPKGRTYGEYLANKRDYHRKFDKIYRERRRHADRSPQKASFSIDLNKSPPTDGV